MNEFKNINRFRDKYHMEPLEQEAVSNKSKEHSEF